MDEHRIRILYETSPEKLERLRERVSSFATATRIRKVWGRMFLEAEIIEDILLLFRQDRDGGMGPGLSSGDRPGEQDAHLPADQAFEGGAE